jgi:hypothetical protein
MACERWLIIWVDSARLLPTSVARLVGLAPSSLISFREKNVGNTLVQNTRRIMRSERWAHFFDVRFDLVKVMESALVD